MQKLTRPVAVCALYGAIAAVFCAPLFEHPNGLGITDWDPYLFYYGSVLKNVVEYGQLPFWNPWYCGGNVLWQNPQIAILSPVYPLASIMSLALAMKVNIFLHYWVGFIGMHLLLTRILGLSYMPLVVYLASMFTLAGAFALHLNVGHAAFLAALYLPLQLFFFIRSLKTGSLRDALLGGAILALLVYDGGVHVVPMSLVGVGSVAIVASAARRRWQPLVLGLVLTGAGLGYAAPKLLPVTLFVTGDQFEDARTGVRHPDRMTVGMILRAYLDPYQHRSLNVDGPQRHPWHEYGNNIGSLGVILVVSSVIWVFAARKVPDTWLGMSFATTALLLLALSAGEFSRFAPASMAAHLPFFSSFRIPSRYTVAFPLFAVATIGWVAKSLAVETAAFGALRKFIGIVCTIAALQLLVENRAQFRNVFSIAPLDRGFRLLKGPDTLTIDAASSPVGSNSPMLRALMDGRSLLNCYESLQLRRSADPSRPIIFGDGQSTIVKTRFSPNRIEFSVVAGRAPSLVVLNQNYSKGWRSTAGAVTPDPQHGLPSVTLAPGQAGKFSFSFVPPGLWLGLMVFAGAIVGSTVLWTRRLAVSTWLSTTTNAGIQVGSRASR